MQKEATELRNIVQGYRDAEQKVSRGAALSARSEQARLPAQPLPMVASTAASAPFAPLHPCPSNSPVRQRGTRGGRHTYTLRPTPPHIRPPTHPPTHPLPPSPSLQRDAARRRREEEAQAERKNPLQQYVEMLGSQEEAAWKDWLIGMGQVGSITRGGCSVVGAASAAGQCKAKSRRRPAT